MLIEFDYEIPPTEKLKRLFEYHNFTEFVKIDEQDIPLLVMALNQDDVANIFVDSEGGLMIEYYGEEWQNNEQRPI